MRRSPEADPDAGTASDAEVPAPDGGSTTDAGSPMDAGAAAGADSGTDGGPGSWPVTPTELPRRGR